MHSCEEATIRAFIGPSRRDRWLAKLLSPKRQSFLDRLNHLADLDERYATPLSPGVDPLSALRSRGAPATCFAISDLPSLDGRELPLKEAIEQIEAGGMGTILCCIPGRLAYYCDEAGTGRRLLLEQHDR